MGQPICNKLKPWRRCRMSGIQNKKNHQMGSMMNLPEDHPRCSPAELRYIRSDPAEAPTRISWLKLATYRQTWAFSMGKFIIDPIWWFFLFWIPDFLQRRHGLSLLQIGWPIVVIYLMAD